MSEGEPRADRMQKAILWGWDRRAEGKAVTAEQLEHELGVSEREARLATLFVYDDEPNPPGIVPEDPTL